VSLARIDVSATEGAAPATVAAFIADADARILRFYEEGWRDPIVSFVPSDYLVCWRVIDALVKQRLAHGKAFCEWGSGFGVVAGLAALSGFQACGIEIEPRLIEAARRLARDHRLQIEYARGNFVPTDAQDYAQTENEFSWLAEGGADGHTELCLDPDDFDVIFAYPWPGEEGAIDRLFHHVAAPGALLVTFHGKEGVHVQRKMATGRSSHR